jgi:hypothetical protein
MEHSSPTIVLRVDGATNKTWPDAEAVVLALRSARLSVSLWKGWEDRLAPAHKQAPSDIYIEVTASNERLLEKAESSAWTLRLDKERLRSADRVANKDLDDAVRAVAHRRALSANAKERVEDPLPWEDFAIPQRSSTCLGKGHDPYDFIYAPYTPAKSNLFAQHASTGCALESSDALQLLLTIIETPTGEGGAGIALNSLVARRKIKGWLPLHEVTNREHVESSWLSFRNSCARGLDGESSLDKLSAYFGERIGMYFAFLAHLTSWMLVPALVGIGVMVAVFLRPTVIEYLPIYGLFTAIWATLTIEYWKRGQASHAMKWGMSGYKSIEPVRGEFMLDRNTKHVRSFVTGRPTFYVNPSTAQAKIAVSGGFVTLLLGLVVVIVLGIFVLRVVMEAQEVGKGGHIPNGYGIYVTSGLNAVAIQLLNVFYNWFARALTAWENHSTATSHDNSLIIKLASFYCLNAFLPLLWVAAIKNYISIGGSTQACPAGANGVPDCFSQLQTQLAIQMLTRLVFVYLFEYAYPIAATALHACWTRPTNEVMAASMEDAKMNVSRVENEAAQPAFEVYDEYLDQLVNYGFTTLFVVAFPLAPAIALISNEAVAFFKARQILHLRARPQPQGAAGIGAWQACFEIMTYLAVIVNTTICVFTNSGNIFGKEYGPYERLLFFIVAEHLILMAKYAMANYIPDTSPSTKLQLERADHLIAVHINGVNVDAARVREEEEDEEAKTRAAEEAGAVARGVDVGLSLGRSSVDFGGLPSYWTLHKRPVRGGSAGDKAKAVAIVPHLGIATHADAGEKGTDV